MVCPLSHWLQWAQSVRHWCSDPLHIFVTLKPFSAVGYIYSLPLMEVMEEISSKRGIHLAFIHIRAILCEVPK